MQRKPLTANDSRHGTSVAYRHYGCRCAVCKDSEAKRRALYMARPGIRVRHAESCKPHTADARKKRSERHTRWARKNPQYQRILSWRKQGIDLTIWSWSAYLAMLDAQNARCPGCGRGLVAIKHAAPDGFEVAYVDHDHTTGHVRRLLCRGCNTALGGASDSPSVLRRLADLQEQYERSKYDVKGTDCSQIAER